MKASELRISNLVYDSTGTTHKIEGVYPDRDYSKYKPIELTEEWLLKFGFKKDGEYEHDYTEYYYSKSIIVGQSNHSERIRITLPNNHCEIGDMMDDMMYLMNTNINHVHQLQNLYYCLTGEELKISNDEKVEK